MKRSHANRKFREWEQSYEVALFRNAAACTAVVHAIDHLNGIDPVGEKDAVGTLAVVTMHLFQERKLIRQKFEEGRKLSAVMLGIELPEGNPPIALVDKDGNLVEQPVIADDAAPPLAPATECETAELAAESLEEKAETIH